MHISEYQTPAPNKAKNEPLLSRNDSAGIQLGNHRFQTPLQPLQRGMLDFEVISSKSNHNRQNSRSKSNFVGTGNEISSFLDRFKGKI
jgi:hypothetical protein